MKAKGIIAVALLTVIATTIVMPMHTVKAATGSTVLLSGLTNATALQSSRDHELVLFGTYLFGTYHGTPSIVLFNEHTNHVIAHMSTGGHVLTNLLLDEDHHRVYGEYQITQGGNSNPTQVWGFDLLTGRTTFYVDAAKNAACPTSSALEQRSLELLLIPLYLCSF